METIKCLAIATAVLSAPVLAQNNAPVDGGDVLAGVTGGVLIVLGFFAAMGYVSRRRG